MAFRLARRMPSVALATDVVQEPTVVVDGGEALDSAGSNIELPEIGEEVLSPEGEPIEDWKPQAASSLRDLTSLEPAPIEVDTWDDDGDDVGLPQVSIQQSLSARNSLLMLRGHQAHRQ